MHRSDIAITRGPKGLFPCTVCFVPQDKQSIVRVWERRTAERTEATINAGAFEHIRRKGPAKNFSTTIGEHGHVDLKADFRAFTNGRDFETQV